MNISFHKCIAKSVHRIMAVPHTQTHTHHTQMQLFNVECHCEMFKYETTESLTWNVIVRCSNEMK